MQPRLVFKDEGISERVGCFIDKSLQLHKAPKLHELIVELGPHYPVDVDVGEWVEKAVNGGVRDLEFNLLWSAEPTSLPKSLYTCKTLVDLTLSDMILVDVSSSAHLPSLEYLTLNYVVYKDEDSLDRLLSSSNVLQFLMVHRHESDNLKTFTVKVSSLKKLCYRGILYEEDEVEEGEEDEDDLIESLVIDCPALRDLSLWYLREEDYLLIKNMHCLDMACIGLVSNPVKYMRSISSVKHMYLYMTQSLVECCYAIVKFSQLIEFCFIPDDLVDWSEPLKSFLRNSPKLKTLIINNEYESHSLSWNQPSTIPECLSNHLEVFRWKDYRGREDEKRLLTYILANSKYSKQSAILKRHKKS